MFFLCSSDELAVNEPVEGFYVGGILLNCFLIVLDGHKFVFLRLVALRSDEGSAAIHFTVAVGVFELQF